MAALENFFRSLDTWGLTDVLLPFLLVFTIVFAVLQKSHILGQGKKNYNVIVALVLAFSVVLPHVTGSWPINYDPVDLINGALPSVSVVVVAIMMLLILIGVFAHDKVMLGLTMPGWVALFSFLVILYIFGASAGWWASGGIDAFASFFGEEAVSVFILILVFGVIVAFITQDDTHDVGVMGRLGVNLGELFGGKGGGGGH
ncbi:hypothetical protein J4419_05930 [Candidatus Woesearchaeota archaeon]|nr:hypothetical protein [Candidatus Woesearchaeota archaeon]